MIRPFRRAIGLMLAASFAASTAHAVPTIGVDYLQFENGSRRGTITPGGGVLAGQFRFDVKDRGGVFWDDTLNAFCIDVTTRLDLGHVTYAFESASESSYLDTDGRQLSLISQLYDKAASKLGAAKEDAAFQLALWEIIYDFHGPLSLTGGTFSATQFDGARGVAQSWLDLLTVGADYASSRYEFFVLDPRCEDCTKDNQTLLTARRVPEAGAVGLLGIGLLMVGALRRRSRVSDLRRA